MLFTFEKATLILSSPQTRIHISRLVMIDGRHSCFGLEDGTLFLSDDVFVGELSWNPGPVLFFATSISSSDLRPRA